MKYGSLAHFAFHIYFAPESVIILWVSDNPIPQLFVMGFDVKTG